MLGSIFFSDWNMKLFMSTANSRKQICKIEMFFSKFGSTGPIKGGKFPKEKRRKSGFKMSVSKREREGLEGQVHHKGCTCKLVWMLHLSRHSSRPAERFRGLPSFAMTFMERTLGGKFHQWPQSNKMLNPRRYRGTRQPPFSLYPAEKFAGAIRRKIDEEGDEIGWSMANMDRANPPKSLDEPTSNFWSTTILFSRDKDV